MAMTICSFNGSPHRDGHTAKAIEAVTEYLQGVYGAAFSLTLDLPVNLQGCLGCEKCVQRCRIKDDFSVYLAHLQLAKVVLIATPVYLDMPTAQTVAFLTRLNCMAESTGRKFFQGKDVHLLAVSYCSGTKTAIHTMMAACEMLGFNISGRSTWEHSQIWKDNKVRGGNGANVYIKE
jgi:multimeric flavodoxin WrbA